MTRDLHRAIQDWFAAVEGPGIGRVGSAADPAVTADGARLAVTTFTRHSLDQPIGSAVAVLDLATGGLEPVVAGAHDRLPRWSPDGRSLAWLTDRGLLTDQGGPDRARPAWSAIGGTVAVGEQVGTAEDVAWSPDGRRLLVLVREADAAGPTSIGVTRAGARISARIRDPAEDWHPTVLRPAEPGGRRSIVVVDTLTGEVRPLGDPAVNVWEAVWCGPDAVAAVVSDGPGEETWYSPRLVLFDGDGPGPARPLYAPTTQLGRPTATTSGSRVAVVEAFCSDRSLVAGTVVVAEVGGPARSLDTAGVDVSCCAWLGEELLAFIGVRGLQTVAGEVDLTTGALRETWVSDGSTSGAYPQAAWGPDGSLTVVAESYDQPPHVIVVSDGAERTVLDLAHDGTAELLRRAGEIETMSWLAPDGLRVEGLLVRPSTPGPHPLVLDIHGGPVWAWRNQFRMGQYTTPLLAALGYAVLFPNPRGSSGRGGAYARLVERDVCGPDTGDFLSGLDHLVTAGIADPTRIAVTGTSYGGTMSCWLPTQDTRFAAAVPVAGGTDWVSFHFTTDIPDFDELVLPGDALDPGGEYVRRSPLTHAGKVSTPILHLAGLLDTCVPVSQAMEFHRALSLRGAVSELVVYPGEGHGVHDFPAVADAVTRTVSWIVTYAPPDPDQGAQSA